MKKIIFIFFILIYITGCGSTEQTIEQEKYANYSALYKTILDTSEFLSGSDYFDSQLVVNPLDDGTYRYYVIIDNPQIAMYDVTALSCLTSKLDITSGDMCPNIGVYDDKKYILIPNQKNVAENYVSGLSLSAISDSEDVTVDIVVEWYDKNHSNNYRQLIQLSNSSTDVSPEASTEASTVVSPDASPVSSSESSATGE